MAADPTTVILTDIAIILLLGLVITIIAKKVKLPNILLLIVTGLVLGVLNTNGLFTLNLNSSFLVAIAVLTLVMVVFDGSSRFELRMVDLFSLSALKVSLLFLITNMLFLTFFTTILVFGKITITTILFSLLYAIVMSGTDPTSVFIMLKSKANKVIEFLEIEAIINTPIMVILPFIILDIINNLHTADVTRAIMGQFVPLLQQIIVGVGSGVIIGIIVFKSMKKFYSQNISPVATITAALLAYILAENLNGNGVLAVATLGIFFGNSYVKEKESLQEFNTMLNSSLIILVFILTGLIIKIDFTAMFMLKALILYTVLIITRFVAISWGLKGKEFNTKEKLFMVLSMPKGIAATVVAFSLSVFNIAVGNQGYMNIIVQLIIISMVYSLILSAVIDRFSKKLIRIKLEEK